MTALTIQRLLLVLFVAFAALTAFQQLRYGMICAGKPTGRPESEVLPRTGSAVRRSRGGLPRGEYHCRRIDARIKKQKTVRKGGFFSM